MSFIQKHEICKNLEITGEYVIKHEFALRDAQFQRICRYLEFIAFILVWGFVVFFCMEQFYKK